jgi:hypothetical protein
MQQTKTAASLLRYAGLLAGLAYLILKNFRNQVPVDAGDGLLHYAIARQSWNQSFYFLDHWGKPLFTLLSSGFAQAGFKAYVVFNILVFALTALTAFALFRRLKVATAYFILFPLLLICIPDYAYCVLGGMTEPLFGLLLTLAVYTAVCQRWMLFGLIVSFVPFARSEGMLVVVLAFVLLVIVEVSDRLSGKNPSAGALSALKPLLMLPVGFVIYGLIGWMLLGSFWWYFENNPYPEKSIYGSGPWHHYIATWKNHFGLITLLLFPFGMFGCIVLWKKQLIPHFAWILLFTLAVYFGIVAVHSYFWAFGLKGAAGLTRLAVLGTPALLLFVLIGCHYVTAQLNAIPHLVTGLGITLLVVKEIRELPYPLKANPFERVLIESADYASAHYPGKKIYYFHPLIPWRLNAGVKDTDSNLEQRFFLESRPETITGMEPGSVLLRDPQFGPVEQGLTFGFIEAFPEKLVKKKVFHVTEPYSVYTGEEPEVILYEVK